MSKRGLCFIAVLVVAAGSTSIAGIGWHSPWGLASAQTGAQQTVTVEQVLIRGNRRIPETTIKIWIGTREGDPYNPAQIDRDIRALYAQGHFEDVKAFAEEGSRGGKVITFEVRERPLLLDIKYEGLKSVQQSTVLEEFRKRTVGLSKESQYDPVKVRRAAAVIKDLLSDEGHPEAKVEPLVEEISKTAVGLTFKIDEGPRFRVAEIQFEGNTVYSNSYLRSQMKLVKQVGLFTTFSSKDIYHKEKLQADLDRLRVLVYADNGYLKARFGEPRVEDAGEVGTWIPIVGHKGQGLRIVIHVDEGRQYRAAQIKVEENKEFTAKEIESVIGLKSGDIVRGYTVVQKGLENLKKLYGSRGYIQFNSDFVPEFHDDPKEANKGTVDITFAVDEGKQYTLRRIEFIGNTFTRDNVLRREVLLNEGERYNEQLWDYSILRLNQLGYFDQVKKEDATINTNEREGQVDLTLKVQEKGRQQISFTGGVSGIGGSYIGIDYSTNNLLGYGEKLSLAFNFGNLQKVASFGFTEPYFRGKPISLGFNIFYQDYAFIGQGYGVISSQSLFDTSGQSLFTQRTKGATVSASAPFSYFAKKFRMGRFIRLEMAYTFRTTDILDPKINSSTDPTQHIPITFREKGVRQSTLTPALSYNTLNNSLDPTSGKSVSLGLALSGGPLGGKVSIVEPTFEFKYFRPFFAGKEGSQRQDPKKTRTLGFRFLAASLSPFGTPFESNSLSFVGGEPLFSRFFMGGETDIRGYNIRGISPVATVQTFISTADPTAQTLSGRPLVIRSPRHANGNSITRRALNSFVQTNQPGDLNQFPLFPAFVGGDTELLFNAEYRIPIFGPLAFAPFFDIGSVFDVRALPDQIQTGEFLNNQTLSTVILDPRGLIATRREIKQATPPESSGGLPPGFQAVNILGQQQINRHVLLSQMPHGIFDNYRYSMGGELRVQVPVINVPFRLIFALNPNARVDNPFFVEKKRAIRFSVGRTF